MPHLVYGDDRGTLRILAVLPVDQRRRGSRFPRETTLQMSLSGAFAKK